jgi:DNA-binding CsgD family transcriptional regulator
VTDKQKEQIANLRHAGYSYSVIADKLGLSVNTIKTHCKRHGLSSK